LDLESYQEEIGISPNVLGPTPNNGVGLFFVLTAISLTASCIVDKELDLMRYNRFSVGETDPLFMEQQKETFLFYVFYPL
jgi:hypothetical protein